MEAEEFKKKINEIADRKWEQRGGEVPEATREQVKRIFYEMVNEPDSLRGLQLVKNEIKVSRQINRMFEGARKSVRKGVD